MFFCGRVPTRACNRLYLFTPDILYADEPCSDYVEAAVSTALALHGRSGPGDILIFLTGQEEVDLAVTALRERSTEYACVHNPRTMCVIVAFTHESTASFRMLELPLVPLVAFGWLGLMILV